MESSRNLIVDLGVMDGVDTGYYLGKGYRVLAIEADPLKAERCQALYSQEVAAGKLIVLNVGITDREETLPFYRNFENEGWSSFVSDMGTRGGNYETLTVRCVTLAEVIREYGVPYYLKIDIEGMDEQAVSTLSPELAPDYISVEVGFSEGLFHHLERLGYASFKLINQEFHTTSEEIQSCPSSGCFGAARPAPVMAPQNRMGPALTPGGPYFWVQQHGSVWRTDTRPVDFLWRGLAAISQNSGSCAQA
jgi:FkbM family methyltransferase